MNSVQVFMPGTLARSRRNSPQSNRQPRTKPVGRSRGRIPQFRPRLEQLETRQVLSVFFAANDGTHGNELWGSDGTAAGMVLIKDINPLAGDSNPTQIVSAGNYLFFAANDGTNGNELWISNGSATGTSMVKDINPGAGNADPQELTISGGNLYFTAVDGTGSRKLYSMTADATGSPIAITEPSGAHNLTDVAGTLFFAATDPADGEELWKAPGDPGTGKAAQLVWDIQTGAGSSSPQQLMNANGVLLFSADDGVAGRELWKSDGTALGTVPVKDINGGAAGSSPTGFTYVTALNATFFAANNGAVGNELWKTDGTAAGTVLVDDIIIGATSSNPTNFRSSGGRLFFTVDDGLSGNELWSSDGTTAGTTLYGDINPGAGSSSPQGLTDWGGIRVFSADDGTNGRELWTNGGAGLPVQLVKDINPGAASSSPGVANPTPIHFVPDDRVFFHKVFFAADDGVNGRELWITDATGAGTTLLKDINTTGSSNPDWLVSSPIPIAVPPPGGGSALASAGMIDPAAVSPTAGTLSTPAGSSGGAPGSLTQSRGATLPQSAALSGMLPRMSGSPAEGSEAVQALNAPTLAALLIGRSAIPNVPSFLAGGPVPTSPPDTTAWHVSGLSSLAALVASDFSSSGLRDDLAFTGSGQAGGPPARTASLVRGDGPLASELALGSGSGGGQSLAALDQVFAAIKPS